MAQLMGLSIVMYGTIRGLDKPWQGGAWTGLGLVILGLSSNWALTGLIAIATALAVFFCHIKLRFRWTLSSLVIAIVGIGIWPLLWQLFAVSPAAQEAALQAWAQTPVHGGELLGIRMAGLATGLSCSRALGAA